jgi:hypothetical protein
MSDPVLDGEFAFLLDRIAERYLDTDKVLKMFIRNGRVEYEDFEKFVVPLLLTAVVNQTAIMAYLLKKEGHKGFPAEVSVLEKEGGDE